MKDNYSIFSKKFWENTISYFKIRKDKFSLRIPFKGYYKDVATDHIKLILLELGLPGANSVSNSLREFLGELEKNDEAEINRERERYLTINMKAENTTILGYVSDIIRQFGRRSTGKRADFLRSFVSYMHNFDRHYDGHIVQISFRHPNIRKISDKNESELKFGLKFHKDEACCVVRGRTNIHYDEKGRLEQRAQGDIGEFLSGYHN